MKKVLAVVVTVCVVFGATAAFAQPRNFQGFENRGRYFNQPMNFQGQPGQFCEPNWNGNGNFGNCAPRQGDGYGRRGYGYGCYGFEGGCRGGFRGRMNFFPDMPKEIREKAVELAKLRIDLEEAMSSDPINKAKALDTHAKMQKLEQEIEAWRFAQKLERIEEFKKHAKLNREVPPAPVREEEAKDAQTK